MNRRFWALALGCWLVLPAFVVEGQTERRAQRKPEPPPPPKEEIGASPEFLAAYEKLRSPRLGISVIALGGAVEGDRMALESRLSQHLSHPDVTIINVPAADLLANREFEVASRNNCEQAARIMANETKSDYAILVTLLETGGRADGVRYRAEYVVVDGNRGHRVGGTAWDMEPRNVDGTYNARQLNRYAKSIADAITKDFSKLSTAAAKFTLRLVGMEPGEIRAFTRALEQVGGVQKVLRRGIDDDATGTRLATFEVRYSGGDMIDLQDEAASLLTALNPQQRVRPWTSREGLVTLALTPRPQEDVTALLNGDLQLSGGDANRSAEVARFKESYQKAGRPRIALMINRCAPEASAMDRGERMRSGADPDRPAPAEETGGGGEAPVVAGRDGPAVKAAPGSMVVIVERRDREPDPRRDEPRREAAGSQPPDAALLLTREIEDRMLRRLRNGLGVDCREVTNAIDQVLKEQRVQERIYGEHELVELLAAKEVADVLILGTGMVLPSGQEFEVRYTFRAYSVKNSKILATSTVSGSVEPKSPRLNEILNSVNDSVASKAVGELAYFMRDCWVPPSAIIVEVSNVKAVGGMVAIMEWFRKLEAVNTVVEGDYRGGVEGGTGQFEVVYDCDFTQLIEMLRKSDAPFSLEGQDVSRDVVKIKALDK